MTQILRGALRRHTAVAAYLSLFVALGGTAYAAATVTGADIVDATISGQDVADRGLAGRDVAYNTIDGYNIKDGSVSVNDLGVGLDVTHVEKLSSSANEMHKEALARCPAGAVATGGGAEIQDAANDYASPANLSAITRSAPLSSGQGWIASAEVIDFPSIPNFTLSYNDDNVVDGFESWLMEDKQTHRKPWTLRTWAVCLKLSA